MHYNEKLAAAVNISGSVLCLGLDPVPESLPEELGSQSSTPVERIAEFCKKTIELTSPYVAAYKLNTAYFEALGPPGFELLSHLTDHIPDHVVTIADAKRGDVPHTGRKYKEAFFDQLQFDAITLSPLMGRDTLLPFLEDYRKACYILTLTSNSGASDFFMQRLQNGKTLSEEIAGSLNRLADDVQGQPGMVIGATQIRDADPVCGCFPESHTLMPGIGAQQGSREDVINLINKHRLKALVPISRGIIEAHKQSDHSWTEAIVSATRTYNHDYREPTHWHEQT